jgi:hypothetical protein
VAYEGPAMMYDFSVAIPIVVEFIRDMTSADIVSIFGSG